MNQPTQAEAIACFSLDRHDPLGILDPSAPEALVEESHRKAARIWWIPKLLLSAPRRAQQSSPVAGGSTDPSASTTGEKQRVDSCLVAPVNWGLGIPLIRQLELADTLDLALLGH